MKKVPGFIGLLLILACNESNNKSESNRNNDSINKLVKEAARDIAGNFSEENTIRFNASHLNSFFLKYDSLRVFEPDINNFYTTRKYSFAWYTEAGLTEQATNLYMRLENLPEEGLHLSLPYKRQLDSLINLNSGRNLKQNSETELLLTALYFFFAQKVWGGLEESASEKINWHIPRKKLSYSALLDSMVTHTGNGSSVKEPVYGQYTLLKNYLKKYKAIPADKMVIPPITNVLQPGDTSPVIALIKRKLFLLGDLTNAEDTSSYQYDSTLLTAVKSFQKRHGMKDDGIVRSSMIRQLNEPIEKRIEKIMVNMERFRWLPIDVRGKHLAVNIPEYMLHAYNDDTLLWDMNVVVGRDMNKTVVFAGKISQIVFNPYWNVPPLILKREILPGIEKDNNYLVKHHMERYGNTVRQKPGPWNSLGKIKFSFPNSYNIYLHDTPSKNLFKESRRAFSHGCIRLAEPEKLAKYLLNDDSTWTSDRITQAIHSGKEQYVPVKNPMPVFITYFTAFVDRQGQLNFREDIYNRDRDLANLLMKRP